MGTGEAVAAGVAVGAGSGVGVGVAVGGGDMTGVEGGCDGSLAHATNMNAARARAVSSIRARCASDKLGLSVRSPVPPGITAVAEEAQAMGLTDG